jgi:hypothetical protein
MALRGWRNTEQLKSTPPHTPNPPTLTPPGPPLLSALGELEVRAGSLQRPARFFADFHPDPDQRGAAAAVLEVARLAAAEVLAEPRVVAALLATAAALLPSEAQRCRLAVELEDVAAADGSRDESQQAGALAALAAAAAALDNQLYAISPCEQLAGQQQQHVHQLLACRQALRAAAAACSLEVLEDGGAEGGAPHPYDTTLGGGGGGSGQQGGGDATAAAASTTTVTSTTTTSTSGGSAARAAVETGVAAFARLVSDPRLAPVLLLTAEQADVIRPLLRDARIDDSAWAPLVTSKRSGATRQAAGGSSSSGDSSDSGGGGFQLRCSRQLRMFPGPGGLVELTGLVSATEAAHDWLEQHMQKTSQKEQRQSAAAVVPQRGWLQVPGGSPLRALVVTRDVASLLLQQHPNADVRRQLHASGALPRRRLLLTALTALAARRGALARERGAASYADLLLSEGSPLRCPAAVDALLRQLAGGVAAYAQSELSDMRRMVERRARVTGAAAAGGGAIAPWDVDYCLQAAAVVSCRLNRLKYEHCFCRGLLFTHQPLIHKYSSLITHKKTRHLYDKYPIPGGGVGVHVA